MFLSNNYFPYLHLLKICCKCFEKGFAKQILIINGNPDISSTPKTNNNKRRKDGQRGTPTRPSTSPNKHVNRDMHTDTDFR